MKSTAESGETNTNTILERLHAVSETKPSKAPPPSFFGRDKLRERQPMFDLGLMFPMVRDEGPPTLRIFFGRGEVGNGAPRLV